MLGLLVFPDLHMVKKGMCRHGQNDLANQQDNTGRDRGRQNQRKTEANTKGICVGENQEDFFSGSTDSGCAEKGQLKKQQSQEYRKLLREDQRNTVRKRCKQKLKTRGYEFVVFLLLQIERCDNVGSNRQNKHIIVHKSYLSH